MLMCIILAHGTLEHCFTLEQLLLFEEVYRYITVLREEKKVTWLKRYQSVSQWNNNYRLNKRAPVKGANYFYSA